MRALSLECWVLRFTSLLSSNISEIFKFQVFLNIKLR